MRLLVIGSTGGTGRQVLAEGVRRGHAVTAFARDPAALAGVEGLAGVVAGDARDPEALRAAVAGQDAVVMAVSPAGVEGAVTAMAAAVCAALDESGPRRLVMTSAYGIVARKPYVVASLVRFFLRATFADQRAADAIVERSGLGWTLVRPTRLTNRTGCPAPRATTGAIDRAPYAVGREAVARVLVDLADSRDHTGAHVNVSG